MACLLAVVLLSGVAAAQNPPWWAGLGVRDLKGGPLAVKGRWIVVVFLGQECPVSNVAISTLNRLAAEFGPRGFDFVGAYVDATADLPALREHAAAYAVGFATADDRAHRLVNAAGATYTPEVAVFTPQGARLYRGRIDDRVGDFGAARPTAAHQDLRDALAAIAAGRPIPSDGRHGFGCAIPELAVP
jgi:hypothetical protein